MIIYTNILTSRDVDLFANSFRKEFGGTIIKKDISNIYDIILVDKPDYIIIDSLDEKNEHFVSFLSDLKSQNIQIQKTKIIIIGKSGNSEHQNIRYVSPNTYYCFDEYYTESSCDDGSFKYMLCHLNCLDFEKNKALEPIIYPNNKEIAVKLVGCDQVQHVQNLGSVTEREMLELIHGCEIYINIDNMYVYDAMFLNKPIINSCEDIKEIEFVNNLSIDKASTKYDRSKIMQYRISNIVKHINKL
jgi:hypothetical protein